jgi:hypothetical protein
MLTPVFLRKELVLTDRIQPNLEFAPEPAYHGFPIERLSSRSEDARRFLQFHQVQKGIVDGLARVSDGSVLAATCLRRKTQKVYGICNQTRTGLLYT